MATLLEKVRSYSENHTLIEPGSKILVGLSGGADSVALLYLLNALAPGYNLSLVAAHFDHQWRENSAADKEFCHALARQLNIEFVAQTASVYLSEKKQSHSPNGSQEELGRTLRRAFFEEYAHFYGAHAIALGHHEDDQQETFFLRLIRGASIAGLAAMKPKNGRYIRPLLSCTKAELIEYLKQQGLTHREDPTNNDTKYLRNAIRHIVIPAFQQSDPRFTTTFRNTLHSVQETDRYLAKVVDELFTKIASTSENTILLHHEEFLKVDEFLHPRILVAWLSQAKVPYTPSTAFFDELTRFIKNSGKKHQLHPSWSLVKKGPYLAIENQTTQIKE